MSALAELRRAAGKTQEKLAENIGVSVTTVWRWENGKDRPRARRLHDLARELKISRESLVQLIYSE